MQLWAGPGHGAAAAWPGHLWVKTGCTMERLPVCRRVKNRKILIKTNLTMTCWYNVKKKQFDIAPYQKKLWLLGASYSADNTVYNIYRLIFLFSCMHRKPIWHIWNKLQISLISYAGASHLLKSLHLFKTRKMRKHGWKEKAKKREKGGEEEGGR